MKRQATIFRYFIPLCYNNSNNNNNNNTPWSRVLLEKLSGSQLVKEFPAFYGTRKFITAFTSARHLSLSRASSIQSIPPNPTSWRPILILSSRLSLDLPRSLSVRFPHQNLIYFSPPIRDTCPVHFFLLDFVTRTILGEEYRSLSSSLCSYFHFPVTSYLLGPNILINTLFSNALSLLSSLSVSDQVLHPYKTTGRIIVLYILIFKFLYSRLEYKRFFTYGTESKKDEIKYESYISEYFLCLEWVNNFRRVRKVAKSDC